MIAHSTTTHPAIAQITPVSAALLQAENTGELPLEAWPLLRALLLAAADPQLVAAVEPLRQLVQVRQAVATARQELDRGYAAVIAMIDSPVQLAEAATHLSLLADELAARAQQLVALQG